MNGNVDPARIRASFSACLSGLSLSPRERARIAENAALPRRRPARRTLPRLALALIFALTLLCATALAVSAWREYAARIPERERQGRFYADWTPAEKVELVRALAEAGYLPPDAQADAAALLAADRPDGDAAALADAIVSRFTGLPPEDIGFMALLQSAWGAWDGWTDEERAFVSEAERDAGYDLSDKTVYGEPEAAAITRDQAVEAARAAVGKLLALSDAQTARYAAEEVDYQAKTEDGRSGQWHVVLRGEGADLPLRGIELFVDARTGAPQEDLAESLLSSMRWQWYDEHRAEIDPQAYGESAN